MLFIQTPRGRVFTYQTQNGKVKARLEWNPGFQNKYNSRFNNAQEYVDNEVLRRSDKYTPRLTGALIKTGILGTEIGSGEIVYLAPYGRYQYYGKKMIGNAPKIVTNTPLRYHGGNLRGSYWFERMKADHKEKILKGARKFMR